MSTASDQNSINACKEVLRLIADPLVIQIFLTLHNSSGVRFNDLMRTCDTNAVTLTRRLKSLEEAELVSRIEKTASKQSVMYLLSPLGVLSMPIVVAVKEVATALIQRNPSDHL